MLSTVSPYGPKAYAERLAELMFETHDVPVGLAPVCASPSCTKLLAWPQGIYLGVPAIFCLYAQGKTSGVVLDSGECVTSAIPVFDGYAIAAAAEQLPFGVSSAHLSDPLCGVLVKQPACDAGPRHHVVPRAAPQAGVRSGDRIAG